MTSTINETLLTCNLRKTAFILMMLAGIESGQLIIFTYLLSLKLNACMDLAENSAIMVKNGVFGNLGPKGNAVNRITRRHFLGTNRIIRAVVWTNQFRAWFVGLNRRMAKHT
jgi:hypothetical protein